MQHLTTMKLDAPARYLLGKQGSACARDLRAAGLEAAQIARLVQRGELIQLSRGRYALPHRSPSQDEALVVVAQRKPESFVCLLTALRFHGLTTQAPGAE